MTVRDRKKQLINEIVMNDDVAKGGMKLMRSVALIILISRIVLALYEAIYLSAVGAKTEVLSYVFLALGIIGCYMIFDGNRGICHLLFFASVIRVLYHLTTVLPILPSNAGGVIFTVINLTVLLTQAVLSNVAAINKKCVAYSNAMQKINLRLQGEIKK